MENSEIIKRITDILKVNGCFSIGELEGENSILVGTLGNYVGLGEYFTEDYVEVNVYEPSSSSSDAIDTYEESYWELNENVLGDVLLLCEQWEAECIRTEKRISD
jgi:spore coat protein CotH